MKGKTYKSYVRSATLYGSKTWCLRENKVAILRRAKIYGEGDVQCKAGGQEFLQKPSLQFLLHHTLPPVALLQTKNLAALTFFNLEHLP